MLEGRMGFAAAIIGDSIVVTGGWKGHSVLSACEQLSIRVDSDEEARWQPLHSMTTERFNHHGLSFGDCMVVVGGHSAPQALKTTEVWNGATDTWTQLPAKLPVREDILGFIKLGDDLVCFFGGDDPSVYCLFSSKGLLEYQRRQIRFNELIAHDRVEIVIPFLLGWLGQRGWLSLFYECIRETNGRLIPQRRRSALGKRTRTRTNSAERTLKEYEERNLAEYTTALAAQVAMEGNDLVARQLAGLRLKNVLVAKDDALLVEKHQAWKQLSPDVRAQVKNSLLQALRSSQAVACHTAAQAAAEVAAIELPYKEWPELVPTLLENLKTQGQASQVASLECLGFTCERISMLETPPMEESTTDAMLTTIVNGMQPSRGAEIHLAAATAMRNSLVFADSNMIRKPERDAIFKNIREATRSTDARVRRMAFECLTEIAALYYDKLSEYMETIFQLTVQAIQQDEEDVAKQAIEFWTSLCEVEIEILDEMEDARLKGVPPPRTCTRYMQAAIEHLGPVLLEALTKQDADAEDEHCNISMVASLCLSTVAQTVEDLVIPVIMPFVTANIQNENWRMREAATMAFASILDGTSAEAIGPAVNQSIPILLQALGDSNALVRDSSAYTIGRICDLHVRSIPAETFPTLINGLQSKLLTESPRIANQACNAIHNVAAAFAEDEASLSTGTNALSQYVPNLLDNLLKCADRKDADEHNLRVTAREAVTCLVQCTLPPT